MTSELIWDYFGLCLAAVAGGAVNSVAGGGTLLTFPALFAALGTSAEASVIANATSTVALCPGSLAASVGYRRDFHQSGRWVALLVAPSLAGGWFGAWLVTAQPAEQFKVLVPWLILTAAVLFALQPTISRWTGIGHEHAPATAGTMAGVVLFQTLVAIYGGYFGAGIGILMLSSLAMMGLADIHRMNALKTLLAACINATAAVNFIAAGKVHWPMATAMAVAAIAGGFLGAQIARRLNKSLVRKTVIFIGFALASFYFYQQFMRKAPETTPGVATAVSISTITFLGRPRDPS